MSEKLKILMVAGILLLIAGIWFLMSKDRDGEVLLARGAASGETSDQTGQPGEWADAWQGMSADARQGESPGASMTAAQARAQTESLGEQTAATVLVHVCGAVCRPGVYELSAQARKAQAIEAAGGFAQDADDAYINLAAGLTDGEQIRVPLKSETAGMPYAGGETVSGLVNINTADLAGLMSLPGIGEAKARAILEYRASHGRFAQASDIMKVSGIKEALFETIKHLITV